MREFKEKSPEAGKHHGGQVEWNEERGVPVPPNPLCIIPGIAANSKPEKEDDFMKDFEYGLCAEQIGYYRQACHMETALRDSWMNRGGAVRYISIYTFPAEYIRGINGGESCAGYDGPCWAPLLQFDLDQKVDMLQKAADDAVKLVECLVGFGLKPENIQIWFSGKKGFHIAVSIRAFGKAACPSERFHKDYKAVAMAVARMAGIENDVKIYDRARLLRAGNAQHPDTRLYKTPVTLEELMDKNAVENIRDRALAPRQLVDISDPQYASPIWCVDAVAYMPVQDALPMCEEIWHQASLPAKKSTASRGKQTGSISKATQAFIAHGAPEGERAVGLFKAAADCTRHGWDEERIKAELTPVGLQSGLEEAEVERQIRCGIEIVKKNEEESSSASGKKHGSATTSQEIADAYIQHILKPENRNLCYTPDDKWWDYSPEDGWGVIEKKAVEPDVERFARRYMKAVHDHSDLPSYRLNSIMSHIQHVLTVTKRIGQKRQTWLDPSVFLTFGEEGVNVQSGAGWVSCHSHLLNVIPLAKYLAAKNRGQTPEGSLESLGLVRPADSSLFTKGKIPCAFDPNAECPRWMQFLEEACPEDAKQLQMMFGLTFTYIDWLPVFFIACGPAGTGKSVMMKMLELLHSGASCNVSLGDFGEKFDEVPLTQHRVNLFADMESVFEGGTASKREAVLKLIAGKESKNTQDKYEKSAKRNLIAWCCFSTNNFPRFQESSSAIADRVRLIRFPNTFRGTDKQDPYLQEKLMTELPGILNWALIGLGELLLNGHRVFPESDSARAEKLEYIKSANSVLMYCDEHLERCGNWHGTETLVLQGKYNEYCKICNTKPVGLVKFLEAVRGYYGLEQQTRTTENGIKAMRLYGVRFVTGNDYRNYPSPSSDPSSDPQNQEE